MLTVIRGPDGGAVKMVENSESPWQHVLLGYDQCDRRCHGRVASEEGCIFKSYQYVGPASILERVQGQPSGRLVKGCADIRVWVLENGSNGSATATFTVDSSLGLRLADRHSEHVACAGFRPVLSAGEIVIEVQGSDVEVTSISNQSTGFCPEPSSWAAVSECLERIGLEHPGEFTAVFDFRLCGECGARNLIKDEWFECPCGAELPKHWNF